MPKQLVLDSYALMSFFQNETGADMVGEIIFDSVEGKIDLSICAVNLGEVWYSIARKSSTEQAERLLREIHNMPIEIVDADWSLAKQAALYKLKGGISYADCYAASLAKLRDGQVVTGDKEFKVLEKDVKVLWLK